MNARCPLKVGNMVKLYTNSGFKVINWVICAIISIPWPVFWLNQHPAPMILEMSVHRVLTCPHHIEFLASYAASSQSPFSIAALNFTKSLNLSGQDYTPCWQWHSAQDSKERWKCCRRSQLQRQQWPFSSCCPRAFRCSYCRGKERRDI